MLNRESTVDFLADWAEVIDERVFRVYLHRCGMQSASSRATCVSQVRKCEILLQRDLFGNTEDDVEQLPQRLAQVCSGFRGLQKGGLAGSLNRFMEYAKSSMRKKYNSLEAINLV